jgi:hypothetical protein
MTKKRLNVQEVAEILIEELDKIQTLSSAVSAAADRAEAAATRIGHSTASIIDVEQRFNNMTMKVEKVDLTELKQIEQRINKSNKRIIIPFWVFFYISVLSMALGAAIIYYFMRN